jgi:hypothetical protein
MAVINPSLKRRTLIVRRHSGTHLIKPMLKYLVGGIYSPKHNNDGDTVVVGKVVVVVRDPRNQIISAVRYKNRTPMKAGAMDSIIADAMKTPKWDGLDPMVVQLNKWAKTWLDCQDHYKIRFEDLCDTEDLAMKTLEGAFDFWGVKVDRDALVASYREHYKHGPTYTGDHSKWRRYFGPRAKKMWKSLDGDLLAKRYGYD